MGEWFLGDWLSQVGDLPLGWHLVALSVIMLLDAIPLLGVLVPGDVAVLMAVGLVPRGAAGPLIAVIAGNLSGWSLSFFAGRYFGGRLRRSRFGVWIGEARWAAAERTLGRRGGRMILIAPFLPVFNALLPLAAGGLRMPYRRFVLCATTGAALWAGLYVLLGMAAGVFGGLLPNRTVAFAATTAIGLVVGWIVLLGLRRQFRVVIDG